MALQSFTITIGALTDAGNNGKNYVNNQPVYIKRTNGTLASIYRDLAGTSQIAQDGLSNVTNSKGQFTFFVEAGDYNAEYQSQVTPITVVGPDYFNSRIDETVNQIILDLSTSRGFRVKGTFAAGFTYELPNDVGLDASGNAWIYTDVDALPFTVPAATSPSFPTYTQVTFNQASNISYTENGNVEDALRKRAGYYTVAEAQAAVLEVGQHVILTDRGNAPCKVMSGLTPNGAGIIDLGGLQLEVQVINGVTYARHFGGGQAGAQAAVSHPDSGKVYLEGAAEYSASVTIPSSKQGVEICPEGLISTITPAAGFTGSLFVNDAKNLEFHHVFTSGEVTLVEHTRDQFETISIHNCVHNGIADKLNVYLLKTTGALSGQRIDLANNDGNNCVIAYADDCEAGLFNVENNIFNNCPRWFVRSLKQSSTKVVKKFSAQSNTVRSINGGMVDKSNSGRCYQVETSDLCTLHDNILDGAESTNTCNFAYIKGSLVCTDNEIKNVKGADNGAIIDDKGVGSADSYWIVKDNDITQSVVTYAEHPECGIRINEGKNADISHNKFRGFKRQAVRVYNSLGVANEPENISVIHNEVYDLDYPVAFEVFQNCNIVSLEHNKVYSITNTLNHNVNSRSECRLVDVYISVNNGLDIKQVSIESNKMFSCPSTSFLAHVFRNAAAVTSNITGLSLIRNEIKVPAAAFVRFSNAASIGSVDLMYNIGQPGIAETIGTEPTMRKVGNVIT
jgi:hypothetical protein